MKNLLLVCLLLTACQGNTSEAEIARLTNYTAHYELVNVDPKLANIEGRIYDSFVQGIMTKETKQMEAIGEQLAQLYGERKHKLIQYWRAYLQYYTAIYHLQAGDEKQSEKACDQGITWMKSISDKNAEDYALLAMLQGFGIQFKGMRAMFISGTIKRNLKKARALDADNLRVQFVSGSNDYYTPAKYGGGKEAEKYLLKAISLPSQKNPNEMLPSWGLQEAYEMLIKMYIKAERWEEAKTYFNKGAVACPNSYVINQLAPKLVGK
ncbi:MAG: hypothetical protein HRU41_41485 [Saprospiraceae bacterium]|nr:hypothetical protein [Saprospiraceae bacterium]